jgi:nucleoid-associated protein YgaU
LNLAGGLPNVGGMKRISILLATLALCAAPGMRAQDAATQERLDKLAGRIEDLTAAQEALKKQMSDLSRELERVREQSAKPSASYARQEDLNLLAEKIKEVDRKRMDDAEKVRTELLKLRKALEVPLTPTKQKPATPPKEKAAAEKPAGDEKVFPYTIQSGDTLEAIVLAYKEKNIKVTVAQILAANPGLKADHLRVGQKIFIPAPKP